MLRRITMDAAQGLAFLLSQLSAIESKLFEVKYQQITYPRAIPVSTEAGPYAESVTYFYMDGAAVAEFVGSKSLDVPVADIGMNKLVVPVELGAIGYEYSLEELRQASFLQRPLPQLKANSARRGFEELTQRTYMLGDAVHNLPGFLNNTNVPSATVVDPGSGTEWVNKTADQILFDVNDLLGDIWVNTKQVEFPNRLALPPAQFNLIHSKRVSTGTDTTILNYLVQNSMFLNSVDDVIALNELTGLGAGATDKMVGYTYDPDKVVAHMPMPLNFLAPQEKGRGFIVPGEFKISGVEYRYPLSARYAIGI